MKSLLLFVFAALQPGAALAHPAAPSGAVASPYVSGAVNYWLADIKRQGTVAFGNNSNYKVYRNIKDYGAKGDGSTDDTDAINIAISAGQRCGQGCDSSTTTPALVYFPPGTYLISKPIVQLYYTQFVGDALRPPTLKAASSFKGIAIIDSDPYNSDGSNWYTNQNNFFRQVRNFVIDLTGLPETQGAGIHWQVAQATSLQNIHFKMAPRSPANKQQGIFMDNGSGGFMSDLSFVGGNYGMFLGNQQFTTRNLTFVGQNTAIFMNWNWAWAFKSVSIRNCGVGLDMANGAINAAGTAINQTVGSVIMLDSEVINTPVGFNTSFSTKANTPVTGGTLILDNVDFTGCSKAVQDYTGALVLPGGSTVKSWFQGKAYPNASSRPRGTLPAVAKPSILLANNKVFERSKPQYEHLPSTAFISVRTFGAKADGITDDTVAIQRALNSLKMDQVLYFDHGAYLVTDTIDVPRRARLTGEIWPLILASGPRFQDQAKPRPVFRVGKARQTGAVEMTDLVFGTAGTAPGAVLMQWDLDGAAGQNGMWDVHFRVGGYAGTQLQSDKCSKDPTKEHTTVNTDCIGAHTLFHATTTASVYLENTWFWVADHELDRSDHNQIDVYNGRGVLIESRRGTWLYGTSSEHNVLYNYQLYNAANVFMSLIQSETPYFQDNPVAPTPFELTASDPTFRDCNGDKSCQKAWGLRSVDSDNVLVYGAGLYSFFQNYGQTCVAQNNCQKNKVSIEGHARNLALYGLSTKAAVNMLQHVDRVEQAAYDEPAAVSVIKDRDNRNNFCATIAFWSPGSGQPESHRNMTISEKPARVVKPSNRSGPAFQGCDA